MSQFQLSFDAEHPDIASFHAFIRCSLELHRLAEIYEPEGIIEIACSSSRGQLTSDSIVEIHLSWLKTTCLEIIGNLSRQQENRRKFDTAIQALFDMTNPDAQSIWANVSRTLRQFRLSGTYEVREIIAEAYSIGTKRIEAGTIIETPLAWLRMTCLNVIRDFRRKQDRLENPKLDGEGLAYGDEVISGLVIAEDRKAIQIALKKLTPEEQQILGARVLQGLTWQAIGESLSCCEVNSINANTARQRGFRALQKLRYHYDAIRQEVETDQDS
jgi:RNA polymerase sigma factor (sigma-70 family)